MLIFDAVAVVFASVRMPSVSRLCPTSPTQRIIFATLVGVLNVAILTLGANFAAIATRAPSAIAWLTLIVWPLAQHAVRVTSGSLIIGGVGLGVAAGIWGVAEEAAQATSVVDLFRLRALLRQRTGFLGLQVSAAVMSTGLLRHTLLDGHYATKDSFPPELVLAYGAYFSALVAVAYLAAEAPLDALAKKIASNALPAPVEIVTWLKLRKEVAELLGLERSATQGLTEGISILAPLLGSLLSIAIPHAG